MFVTKTLNGLADYIGIMHLKSAYMPMRPAVVMGATLGTTQVLPRVALITIPSRW